MQPAPEAIGAESSDHDGRYYAWLLRSSDGGAQGLAFARAHTDVVSTVLVHAAPTALDVEVLENGQRLIAAGRNLHADGEPSPMSRLFIDGQRVVRATTWPDDVDIGTVVLLAGGEAGILRAWSTDPERSRWTWSLEFRGGAP